MVLLIKKLNEYMPSVTNGSGVYAVDNKGGTYSSLKVEMHLCA